MLQRYHTACGTLTEMTDNSRVCCRHLEHLWSPDGLDEQDRVIESSPDGNEIYLRVVRPAGDENLPCVYWIHGGGMANGSAYDVRTLPRARMLAHLGVCVVAVDFRNSGQPSSHAAHPKGHGTSDVAPFPGGLNDCYSGLEWVHDHANDLHIDPSQLVVAGPSGGGNLTIALALLAKQRGELSLLPKGFYALCPYIAGTWPQDVSYEGNPPRFCLGDSHLDSVNNGIMLPLQGTREGSPGSKGYGQSAFDERNPLAWPGFCTAEDVAGLPRCIISVNECDPLRDEGINFYRLCVGAGVDCNARTVLGTIHGGDLNMDALPENALETCRSIVHFVRGPVVAERSRL